MILFSYIQYVRYVIELINMKCYPGMDKQLIGFVCFVAVYVRNLLTNLTELWSNVAY